MEISSDTSSPLILALPDSQVLDCDICFEPLRAPISQANELLKPELVLPLKKCNFSFRVNAKSIVKDLGVFVRGRLTVEEFRWFEESQFKSILNIDLQPSYHPMMMLLSRTIKTSMKRNLWFLLNGIPVRYGLEEHIRLTGLKYEPLNAVIGSSSLTFQQRYFSTKRLKKYKQIEDYIESGVYQEPEDKKRMLLLYVLVSVFGAPQRKDGGFDIFFLEAVQDLDYCKNYPWGLFTFTKILEEVRSFVTDQISKKAKNFAKEGTEMTWYFKGFFWPLMLFPFECVPALSAAYLTRRNTQVGEARLCRWRSNANKSKSPTLGQIMQMVGETKNILSLLVQEAGEEELLMLPDVVDPIDDDVVTNSWTEIVGEGTQIFWEDLFNEDVQGRKAYLKRCTGVDEEEYEDEEEKNVAAPLSLAEEEENVVVSRSPPRVATEEENVDVPPSPPPAELLPPMPRYATIEDIQQLQGQIDEIRKSLQQLVEEVAGRVPRARTPPRSPVSDSLVSVRSADTRFKSVPSPTSLHSTLKRGLWRDPKPSAVCQSPFTDMMSQKKKPKH